MKFSKIVRKYFVGKDPAHKDFKEVWRLMAQGLSDKEIDRTLKARIRILGRVVL